MTGPRTKVSKSILGERKQIVVLQESRLYRRVPRHLSRKCASRPFDIHYIYRHALDDCAGRIRRGAANVT